MQSITEVLQHDLGLRLTPLLYRTLCNAVDDVIVLIDIMSTSLLFGSCNRHTSDVSHTPHCKHQGPILRRTHICAHSHAFDQKLRRPYSTQASRHTCLLPERRHHGRITRRYETVKPHAASSGAIPSDRSQEQPPESNLAQYDKLIIGLAVPALGSILLDPIMSLVDTGMSCINRFLACSGYSPVGSASIIVAWDSCKNWAI